MFRAPLCPSSGAREYYTSGCCLSYLVLWFSSCQYGVELRVVCLVCGLLQQPANRTHNPQLCNKSHLLHLVGILFPHQNSNLEATSAFDFYCHNKQKIQKYVMLHPIWSDKESSPLINHKCVKKRYFTLIAFAFVFIFYVTSNSSSPKSIFWFWYKVLWTKLKEPGTKRSILILMQLCQNNVLKQEVGEIYNIFSYINWTLMQNYNSASVNLITHPS